MKPVRRNIRRHFGLTAKQVAVRSQRPWYFQGLLALLFMLLGFGFAYWLMHDEDNLRERLTEATKANKVLEEKLIGAQRELQVELATNITLAKELANAQDENLKVKEELFFYKNMLKGRR